MKPTLASETAGLRAYEQVNAFVALQRRSLPLIYCGLTLLLVLCGAMMLAFDHPWLALVLLVLAVVFPLWTWLRWRALRERHVKNLLLLEQLQARYGDGLPWLQVERHLAALAELEGELAREKRASEPPSEEP
jgi:ABC-type bacteriocin/lantibiotic exporter with double-glycine peptidase domain